MLNRHRLKEADLTLFTSVSSQSLPYGRIIREMSGQIVGIIEETEASEQVLSIRAAERWRLCHPCCAAVQRASTAITGQGGNAPSAYRDCPPDDPIRVPGDKLYQP